jgi:hypothetical protein
MSEDIVKRLRVSSNLMTVWTHIALHGEAADEIERLRALNAKLEVACRLRSARRSPSHREGMPPLDNRFG